MTDIRRKIILNYAKWTALSALRSGAPIKSRRKIYSLLDEVHFDKPLGLMPPAAATEFDDWHEFETNALCVREPRLVTGWSVKLINIYLKTAAYVGDLGHPCLREKLHPPIDSGLWTGLAKRFAGRSDILDDACCVRRIREITSYSIYRRIITGFKAAAADLGCSLIDVEQLWRGSATPKS